MRALGATIVASAIAVSGLAGAQEVYDATDSFSVTLTASVDPVCVFDVPPEALGEIPLEGGIVTDEATVAAFTDDPFALATGYCNNPTQTSFVTISSQNGGLTLGGIQSPTPVDDFAVAIPYSIAFSWGRLSSTNPIGSSDMGGTATPIVAFDSAPVTGTIESTFSTLSSATPLVAGEYSDTLTVTINPGA